MSIGMTKTNATREKKSPLMEPMEKENQKRSLTPSMRNGMSPTIVEVTVSNMGIIL
jgi:hypothetical protein